MMMIDGGLAPVARHISREIEAMQRALLIISERLVRSRSTNGLLITYIV